MVKTEYHLLIYIDPRIELRIAFKFRIFPSIPSDSLPHLEEIRRIDLFLDNSEACRIGSTPESLDVVWSAKQETEMSKFPQVL